jgi:hypothetical protein
MTNITKTKYKDQEAISIGSDILTAQYLPSIGAKMCSLFYKPLEYELLVQHPGPNYLIQPFDGVYVKGECSGFDDMFPTINTCYYPSYPWQGTKMSDHGEVWSISWECTVDRDTHSLHFSTYGVRFPYRIEKWVSFVNPSTLHIEYLLTNLSPFDFDFLWAAHAMFNLEEDVEILLPKGVESVVGILNYSGMYQYGDTLPWPVMNLKDGTTLDLNKPRPKSTKDAGKFYVKGRLPEGWCGLRFNQSDFTLTLSFPFERVPYLGILVNEGGWRDIYNIFLEPATAPFDRPDIARLWNRISTVKANSTYSWYLSISIE